MQEERKALEGQIQALQADLRARQLTTQEVFAIKPERGLMGSIKGVTVEDIENLKATAIKGLEAKSQLHKLSGDYEQVKRLVPSMQDRIQRGKDMSRLKELETAFQRLPESVQKQLFPSKSQSHTQDRGRKDKKNGQRLPSQLLPIFINNLPFNFRWVAGHPIK